MSLRIHPTAIVARGAKLGSEVEIGPYSVIAEHVTIGDRTRIASHVVIEGHTTLGPENEIFQFASIGAAPQDLKYKGESSTLVIGARNKIRECVTLHPGTAAGTMTTIIGDRNLFMANSHVGHDCRIGSGNVFANGTSLAGHVTVFDNAILGGMVGVHQFCRIGNFALLGAGSMVSMDIPPFCIGQGDRCGLRGVNVIGLQRAGISPKEIAEVKKVYRSLFSTIGRLTEKIAQIPAELQDRTLIKQLVEFLNASQRGVANPAKGFSGSD